MDEELRLSIKLALICQALKSDFIQSLKQTGEHIMPKIRKWEQYIYTSTGEGINRTTKQIPRFKIHKQTCIYIYNKMDSK